MGTQISFTILFSYLLALMATMFPRLFFKLGTSICNIHHCLLWTIPFSAHVLGDRIQSLKFALNNSCFIRITWCRVLFGTCAQTHKYIRIHTHTHARIHTHVHAYTLSLSPVFVCMCCLHTDTTHTFTRQHTHTHTHSRMCNCTPYLYINAQLHILECVCVCV